MYGNASVSANNTAFRNSYNRRQNNVIQFWAPTMKGMNARVAYGVGEEKNTCAVACSPKMWSTSLTYISGPLYLLAAYERHDEYANAAAKTNDNGFKLGGSYTFGATTIGVIGERLIFNGNLGATSLRKTFTVGSATRGPWTRIGWA